MQELISSPRYEPHINHGSFRSHKPLNQKHYRINSSLKGSKSHDAFHEITCTLFAETVLMALPATAVSSLAIALYHSNMR